jgi:hypothetical protein
MMKASAKAMELPSTSQTLKDGCNEDSMHSQPEKKQPMKCLCATLPGLQSYDAQALKDGCLTPSTISLQIFIGTFYIKSVSTSACCLSCSQFCHHHSTAIFCMDSEGYKLWVIFFTKTVMVGADFSM